MPFVLDASASIPLFAPDESPLPALEARLMEDSVLVPAIWPLEIFNVLCMMERRKRVSATQFAAIEAGLRALAVTVEPSNMQRIAEDVLPLARTYGLSIYDASYLELAKRAELPLASLDEALIKAAKKLKVKLI